MWNKKNKEFDETNVVEEEFNSDVSVKRKISLKPVWFDLVIVTVALALAISLLAYVNIKSKRENSKHGDKIATVYYLGNAIKKVDLTKLEEVEVFVMTVEEYPKLEGDMEITFDPEKGAAVTKSGCPDHICQKEGYVKVAGKPIVCLPNNLYIEITIENSKNNGGYLE